MKYGICSLALSLLDIFLFGFLLELWQKTYLFQNIYNICFFVKLFKMLIVDIDSLIISKNQLHHELG